MQQLPNAPPPTPGAPPGQGQKSGASLAIIIIAVVAGLGVLIVAGIGIMAVLGIFGTRKYIAQAKEAEGKTTLAAIAKSVIMASEREPSTGPRQLPPSAAPVPASLSQVSGKKYMSAPSDWSGDGWAEMKFSMSYPQYFQYQWQRTTSTSGVIIAIADFNGDGTQDVKFELPVTCTAAPALTCEVATSVKETR
jgi:hypothetical protein